jgi:hypothetical protein
MMEKQDRSGPGGLVSKARVAKVIPIAFHRGGINVVLRWDNRGLVLHHER